MGRIQIDEIKRNHNEYLGSYLKTLNNNLLVKYNVKIVHVCYMKRINDESRVEDTPDVFYLDYPYNNREAVDKFAKYLDQHEELENVNKKIVALFEEYRNTTNDFGYIWYEYRVDKNLSEIIHLPIESNMPNPEYFKAYLPILDASVNENDSYLINKITEDKALISQYSYVHLCSSFDNDTSYSDGYYLYTLEIINKEKFNIKKLKQDGFELINKMLFMYFYGPISEFTASLERKSTEKVVSLKTFKDLVKNFSHTIFNHFSGSFFILRKLESFIKENNDKTIKVDELNIDELSTAIKQFELIDLGIRIIGGDRITENDIKGKNILGIYNYIKDRFMLSPEVTLIDNFSNYEPEKDIHIGFESEFFSIIYNLLNNATAPTNTLEEKPFDVEFEIFTYPCLGFSIKNPVIDIEQIQTVRDEFKKRKYDTSHGVGIIKYNLNQTNWYYDIQESKNPLWIKIIFKIK